MDPNQDEIYYGIQGERHGPVSPEDVRELVRSGRLTLDDYLWDDKRDDWVSVRNYPQLRELATAVPAPPDGGYAGDAWSAPDGSAPTDFADTAGFGVRLVAHLIDSITLTLPLMMWMMLAVRLSGIDTEALSEMDPFTMSSGTVPGQEEEMERFSLLFYLGVFGLEWLYRALLESSPLQATLGKRAMNLVVTDAQGRRLSFLRATARHWSKHISTLTFYLGFVMIAFTERNQGLHDKIADTFVIHR